MTQNIVKYYRTLFFRLRSLSLGSSYSLQEEVKESGEKSNFNARMKVGSLPPLLCGVCRSNLLPSRLLPCSLFGSL